MHFHGIFCVALIWRTICDLVYQVLGHCTWTALAFTGVLCWRSSCLISSKHAEKKNKSEKLGLKWVQNSDGLNGINFDLKWSRSRAQMILTGFKWAQIGSSGLKWVQKGSNGLNWAQNGSNGLKFEFNWVQMSNNGSNRLKWAQKISSGGLKLAQIITCDVFRFVVFVISYATNQIVEIFVK